MEEAGKERGGYSFEPMVDRSGMTSSTTSVSRDLRRWTAADSDADMMLTKLEFQVSID